MRPQYLATGIIITAGAMVFIIIMAMLVICSCAVDTSAVDAEPTEKPLTENTVSTVLQTVEDEEPAPKNEPELISLGTYTVTAYCPCVKCCGIWSAEHPSRVGTDYIQKTASGTIPTEGRTIAADPSVLPYGTVIVMDGHEYTVEDRGGAVKGNKIDIFFESHEEALNWGKQTKIIYIKGDI